MTTDHALRIVRRNGMALGFEAREQGLWQSVLTPAPEPASGLPSRVHDGAYPSFRIAVAGLPHGGHAGLGTGYASLPGEMAMTAFEESETSLRIVYSHAPTGLEVEVDMQFYPGISIVRQTTAVTNNGDTPVTLTHLSSACMQGVATGGVLPFGDPDKLRLHYCCNTWEGEGQWRQSDLEALGLYPTSVHPVPQAVHLSSTGSWSTGRYLPMLVLEDLETNETWYAQLETSSHWHLEVGYRGALAPGREGALYIQADAASERHGGWFKTLAPGQRFVSAPAAIGTARGGFAEAIRELTAYRRALKPANPWPGEAPVVFNDYMNCLWGDPTIERLEPLIEAAAQAGAEYFCIDAGWFGGRGASWSNGLGDWLPSADRFGEAGLQGVLDKIAARGMVPGLWLEMEVCGEAAAVHRSPEDWFLRRHGARVGDRERSFFNFCHPDVRAYLHAAIDRLVAMGVGYFKNDYNLCIGAGHDESGDAAADGLLAHIRAFYDFIDEVRARHPSLILENCGSGGMRLDYGIMSHFHLASTSDQEIYTRYPSILGGMLAGLAPEQAGIWAYPYPLLFLERERPEKLWSAEYHAAMADGEQTVFNMINGMCGNLYLSGRLDAMDDFNMSLVQEGLAVYKAERAFIRTSYPLWPLGFTRIGDTRAWACVGLYAGDHRRMLLYVWRLDSEEPVRQLSLPGWAGSEANVRQLYPAAPAMQSPAAYDSASGTLTVRLPAANTARCYELLRS